MTESRDSLFVCYNKGCGQKFDPAKNNEDSCTFHPGGPIFHDAYKGWSCCNKKCTDFTEFLNIKGCTRSFHSNAKPAQPEKQSPDPLTKDEVVVYKAPEITPEVKVERPSENAPMVKMLVTVSASLKELLLKQKNENREESRSEIITDEIKIGTVCKNGGCTKTYEGDTSNVESCIYHSGVPIFHEGLKFWSCCKKRTTDFNTFLEQEGCTKGHHLWKKDEGLLKVAECRHDWHQTGSYVVLSLYAKGCDPEKSYVEANPVKLHVVASYGNSSFDKEFILQGIIDVDASTVTMAATKMEIKLKKAGPSSWSKLSLAS